MFKITESGIIVNIKISPNSKKNEIIKTKTNSETKVKITAQPIDGKANKCLVEFLSKNFKVPKTSIKIIKGETAKEKMILFETTDEQKIDIIKNAL